MKKLALPLILVAAFAGIAGAQAPKKAPAAKPMVCAVMPKNTVDIAKATKAGMYADYKGNRYFFCCGGCPEAFKKDPAKFASAPHIKTPKATKPAKAAK
jgi:YHS domain-containing protein